MPQTSGFISANIDAENLSRLANDIVSNQHLDNDINTYNYDNMEHFDLEHHAINRHDRRVIKSKYRKLNKRKNLKH